MKTVGNEENNFGTKTIRLRSVTRKKKRQSNRIVVIAECISSVCGVWAYSTHAASFSALACFPDRAMMLTPRKTVDYDLRESRIWNKEEIYQTPTN